MLTLSNKKGFTLIELVIVMAIVGILAITAIIALSSKSADARNARRKSDMAAVLTALSLQCSDNTATITCTEVSDFAAFSTCSATTPASPTGTTFGRYINPATVLDPQETGAIAGDLCVSTHGIGANTGAAGPCNYSVSLGTDTALDPCDPYIAFAIEEGSDYYTSCAAKNGITLGNGSLDPTATCHQP